MRELLEALYEVITNGEWTDGEQCGEWRISKDVYNMAREAFEDADSYMDKEAGHGDDPYAELMEDRQQRRRCMILNPNCLICLGHVVPRS